MNPDVVNRLVELLPSTQTVLVVVGANPNFDQVASATALVMSLQQAGKEVIFASPQPLDPELEILAGVDQLKHQIGNQNLAISFDYDETAVDKVSYHIDENTQRFHLIIKPRKGAKPLDSSTVEFSLTGIDADLIFLVGVHTFESLEHLYIGYEDFFQQKTVVTFHTFEPSIGNIKLDASSSAALSQAMTSLISSLGLNIDNESATNLLAGIEEVTKGFSSLAVTAETFESVALLMRSGARRIRRQAEKNKLPGLKPLQAGEVEKTSNNAGQPNLKPTKPAGDANNLAAVFSKQKNKTPKPGDLDYEPSGFGPGGAG